MRTVMSWMLAGAATKRSSAICLLHLQVVPLAWDRTNLDQTAYHIRMAMVAMEIEDLVVAIETEHRQVQASPREVTTTEEEHHRQRLSKEAENQAGDRVLVHRHKTATHFPNVQTVCLLDPTSHELAAHLHHHHRQRQRPQHQQAEPMSTHTSRRTKAAKATTTLGRHHATAAIEIEIEIETVTHTTEVDGAIVATQTAQDTTTRTPRHHGSTVM